ncbi:MAG: hypothetical protein ABI700_13275, partial [Chloroflexota bacterium]
IVIMADLDGAPKPPLDGQIAIMLTDVTGNSGQGVPSLALDVNGNVVVNQGGSITPATPGIGGTLSLELTPGINGGGSGIPTVIPTEPDIG